MRSVISETSLAKGREEGLAEGRAEGLAEGRAEGRAEGIQEAIRQLSRRFSPEEIARLLSMPLEQVRQAVDGSAAGR